MRWRASALGVLLGVGACVAPAPRQEVFLPVAERMERPGALLTARLAEDESGCVQAIVSLERGTITIDLGGARLNGRAPVRLERRRLPEPPEAVAPVQPLIAGALYLLTFPLSARDTDRALLEVPGLPAPARFVAQGVARSHEGRCRS